MPAESSAGLSLLLRRKLRSVYNTARSLTPYERTRNIVFVAVGVWMLIGLYAGFLRLLTYLLTVQVIGPFLIWKLTAMALLTTFTMVVLSSLIISLTTLFYSFDLTFLMRSPIGLRAIFAEKSLEAAFYSSWMIALAMFPYVLALGVAYRAEWTFYGSFLALLIPFLLIGATLGMGFTLLLMYFFPSPRTRDAVWLLSSCSVALVYVLLRVSEPERLARPDALQLVAQYLGYLQAPTARFLPSWWLTQALQGWIGGRWGLVARDSALLAGVAAACYGALLHVAGRVYADGYSGAQEGRRRCVPLDFRPSWEGRLAGLLGGLPRRARRATAAGSLLASLLWKERKCFFRDVAHWSQMVLVAALVCVYLFSIHHLPLDSPDVRSFVCFINLGVAGFVLASLGLRFTFPSVSMEGRSYWVLRSAPVSVETMMSQKFLFSVVPMTLISAVLVAASDRLLHADAFVGRLSCATILVMTWTLCGMGVGFGAIFPRFNIPNIHQIESSAGGFIYMAACLFYIGLTLALEAGPVQMHFHSRFGRPDAWRWPVVAWCAAALSAVNAAAFCIPWYLGRRNLETHEE